MRVRTANWFEVGLRYERTADDGTQKKVTERYVVDAFSFTEAEERITEEVTSFISGEFEIKSVNMATYNEIFFSDNLNDDSWYKAKVAIITIDEKTAKEKRSCVNYLVQAHSIKSALNNIQEVFSKAMMDYVVVSIAERKIFDVFEHTITTKDTPKEGA